MALIWFVNGMTRFAADMVEWQEWTNEKLTAPVGR